jgi:drug/metabolite transporter (DMT)-like permease
MSTHTKAVLQALLVTFLWSTSWVLIKIGLANIPPVLFAGLRYGLAFLILLPSLLRPATRQELLRLSRGEWVALAWLGFVFITVTQGAQFLALADLPANTLSLLLSLSSLTIALLGLFILHERLFPVQWAGVAISLIGAFVYFGRFGEFSPRGLALGLLCVLATSVAAIQGRALNRHARLSALTVTGVSLGVGAAGLLVYGLLTEPFPSLTLTEVAIIVLAGCGQYRVHLRLVEPQPAHADRSRIGRDQQHHADPDRHSGLGLPRRTHHDQPGHRPAAGRSGGPIGAMAENKSAHS